MAEFDLVMTTAGLSVQTRAQAGAALVFSRVAVGDGPAPPDKLAAIALSNERREADIIAFDVIELGQARLRAVLDNKDLLQQILIRELGVFAIDPLSGTEVLYAYSNVGDGYDTLPADGGSRVAEQVYDIITLVGAAENVSATLSSQVYAAVDDLETLQENTITALAALLALQASTFNRYLDGML
jgi:hypothetical protein